MAPKDSEGNKLAVSDVLVNRTKKVLVVVGVNSEYVRVDSSGTLFDIGDEMMSFSQIVKVGGAVCGKR